MASAGVMEAGCRVRICRCVCGIEGRQAEDRGDAAPQGSHYIDRLLRTGGILECLFPMSLIRLRLGKWNEMPQASFVLRGNPMNLINVLLVWREVSGKMLGVSGTGILMIGKSQLESLEIRMRPINCSNKHMAMLGKGSWFDFVWIDRLILPSGLLNSAAGGSNALSYPLPASGSAA